MEVVIRDAKAEDVRQIREIYYKTWLATYPNEKHRIRVSDVEDRFKNSFTPESLRKGEERITNLGDTERTLVAEVEGRVVGTSNIRKEKDINVVGTIYVFPEYQRGGIGKMLFTEAVKWFEQTHDIRIDVATYNAQAIAFYESLGFVATGEVFEEEQFRMPSGGIIPEQRMIKKSNK